MKKESYYCDICKEESNYSHKRDKKIQVIFTTEQNEGLRSEPYFDFVCIDLCEQCRCKALSGKAIFASGAMGYNHYFFKDNSLLDNV